MENTIRNGNLELPEAAYLWIKRLLSNALLSEKDTLHTLLKDFDSPFNYCDNLYPEF